MKEFCYLGGQLNTVKVTDYGKLDKLSVIDNFVKDNNFQQIKPKEFRITHCCGYYIPKWHIAEEILSSIPKYDKSRAIDVEYFYLQQDYKIKNFVWPAMVTLDLKDASSGFTYNDKSSYKLTDNQFHY
jgi:hypothetical protein